MQCVAELSQYFFLLAVWHLAFFWRFYKNPYLLSTSEVLSTFYPHWRWMGQQLKSGKIPLSDDIYYKHPACIPFLSTFYPPYFLTSLIGRFPLYSNMIVFHYFVGSLLAYLSLSQFFSPTLSLFGSISLVYNAYNIKLLTPCHAFTSCWIMGMLLPFPWGALCFGMAILGGYFPILITVLPVLLLNPSSLAGIVIGLPQIIPFLWYWPKSIRVKGFFASKHEKVDKKWGSMPWWRYFIQTTFPSDGIHYPEYMFGVGICTFLCMFSYNSWWFLIFIGLIGASGAFVVARIPARWVYLVSFAVIMASISALDRLSQWLPILMTIQLWLLWKNRNIYPHFPFCQWWRKPEYYFSSFKKSNNWPYFSGYMFGIRQKNYEGGFCLAE